MVSEAAHHVLVAESDLGVRELIVELLEDRGIQCAEATNADHAIRMLRHHAFDAVVADLTLFVARRSTFLGVLSSHPPNTRLLLVSAGDNRLVDGDLNRFPLVQKPFDTHTFLQVLEQILQIGPDATS